MKTMEDIRIEFEKFKNLLPQGIQIQELAYQMRSSMHIAEKAITSTYHPQVLMLKYQITNFINVIC